MAVTEWSPFEQDAKVPVVAPGVTTAAAPVDGTDGGLAVRFSVASLVRFRGGTLRGTPARVGPTYPELDSPEVPAAEFERATEVVCMRDKAEDPIEELRVLPMLLGIYVAAGTAVAVTWIVELLFFILFVFFGVVPSACAFS